MATEAQPLNKKPFDMRFDSTPPANMARWSGYEAQINELFNLYKDKVDRLIAVYSSLENSFPDGVINELRDIFSHLAQSLITTNTEDVGRHLDKAHRHMKRAIADAYKYGSMAYSIAYDSFKSDYANVDLGAIDNGEFIVRVTNLNAQAESLIYEAKMVEADANHTTDDLYNAYEKAFKCYDDLYCNIDIAMKFAEALKLKAIAAQEEQQREKRIDRIIGIVGATVGVLVSIASIVIGILI